MRKAVLKGITSYEEKVRKSELPPSNPQFCPLYQGAGWRRLGKAKDKALAKRNWYKDKECTDGPRLHQQPPRRMRQTSQKAGKVRGVKTTTVVFVPSTKGGLLLRMLIDMEETMSRITGFRIKYQEAGGTKMINMFNQNLSRGQHCERSPCPPCDANPEDKRPNCKSKNLVYESVCLDCNLPEPSIQQKDQKVDSDKDSSLLEDSEPCLKNTTTSSSKGFMASGKPRSGVYIGETSRTLHERSSEHLADSRAFSNTSHMVKHWMLREALSTLLTPEHSQTHPIW